MRIAVVGLGGVGGYIVANLSKTSHDVVGFARGKHLVEIQKNGLQIIEDTDSWNIDIKAKSLDEVDGYFDLVLFCVKSYDLESAYMAMSQNVDKNSIILSFANGVSHGDELRELSACKVLDACVYILAHIQENGIIRKRGKVFASVFGGLEKESALVKSIFDEVNLRTKTPKDIKTAIWKKYIFISAFGTLTSYYDESIGYVYEHHFSEAEEVLKEIVNVASSQGIDLFGEVKKSLDTAKGLPYDSSTSMYLDFQHKNKNELNTLSGFIVKTAKINHIKVPIMQKMYDSLLNKIKREHK